MKTMEKIPSGSAHGSGRLGVGICNWGHGAVSKLSRLQRQYVALRNDGSLARAGGGWRHRLPARRGRWPTRLRMKPAPPPRPPTPPPLCGNPRRPLRIRLRTMKPDAVALLGDLQYQVGRYSDFQQSFDLTYGAFKFLHKPAPGNHEFYDEHGETGVGGYGYFAYYNGFLIDTTSDASQGMPLMATISDPCPVPDSSCKAGKTPAADLSPQPIPRADGQAGHFEPTGGLETATYYNGPSAGAAAPTGVGDGWYSYNLGTWHLISLNIECYTQPGGCSNTGTWFACRTRMAEKRSRGESFRVHTGLLASAHVQRY